MRATSSIRSASRCTSASRQGGTVAQPLRRRRARSRAASRIAVDLAPSGSRSPSSRSMRSWRSPTTRGAAGLGIDVDRAGHEPRAAQLDHQPRRQPLAGDRQLGVQLLLEARRGLGAQPERLRGAHDVRADPGGHLHQHARGLVRDLRDLAAHDPGDAARALGVARPAPSRSRSVRSTSSSVVIVSPSPRAPHDDPRRRAPRRGRTRAAAGRWRASRSW